MRKTSTATVIFGLNGLVGLWVHSLRVPCSNWQYLYFCENHGKIDFFSPLGKIAEMAIYFTLHNFFFLSFLMISRRQIISRSAEPIFAIFTSNESFLDVDDRSGPLFFDISRDVAMTTDFVQNGAKLPTPLHLSLWHSETVWDNAVYVQD